MRLQHIFPFLLVLVSACRFIPSRDTSNRLELSGILVEDEVDSIQNEPPPIAPPLDDDDDITLSLDGYQSGRVIAELKVRVPPLNPNGSTAKFFLKANIPLTRGYLPDLRGLKSLGVKDPRGFVVPAQVNGVTYRANGELEIAHISARVAAPVGAAPGTDAFYKVHEILYDSIQDKEAHDEAAFVINPTIENLMQTNGAQFVFVDHYGHEYSVPIFNPSTGTVTTQEFGRNSFIRETFTVAMPTLIQPGQPAPLSHGPQVLAITKPWSGQRYVDFHLRVGNSPTARDSIRNFPQTVKDDMIGHLPFKKLLIRLNQGFRLVNLFGDPSYNPNFTSAGSTIEYELHRPDGSGKAWVLPYFRSLRWHLAIASIGAEAKALYNIDATTLGFVQPGMNTQGELYFSWNHPGIAAYFPYGMTLPLYNGFNMGAEKFNAINRYTNFKNAYNQGTAFPYPLTGERCGHSHSSGPDVHNGNFPGGTLIEQTDGGMVAALGIPEAYLYYKLHQITAEDRQHLLIESDGRPATVETYLRFDGGWPLNGTGGYGGTSPPHLPFEVDDNGNPVRAHLGGIWMNGEVVQWPVASQQNPHWADTLNSGELVGCALSQISIQPHDTQHWIRLLSPTLISIYFGNDLLAKKDLHVHAEMARLSGIMNKNMRINGSGYIGSPYLVQRMRETSMFYPGKGTHVGRVEAWLGVAIAMNAAMTSDAVRDVYRHDFEDLVLTLEQAKVGCTGNTYAYVHGQILGGNYYAIQMFEVAFLIKFLQAMKLRLYAEGVDPMLEMRVNQIIAFNAEAMITPGYGWRSYTDSSGAAFGDACYKLAVSDLSRQTLYCSNPNNPGEAPLPADGCSGGFSGEMFSQLEHGFETTGDIFIQRAIEWANGFTPNIPGDGLLQLRNYFLFTGYNHSHANSDGFWGQVQKRACNPQGIGSQIAQYFTCIENQ